MQKSKMNYILYGLKLQSNIEFPQLILDVDIGSEYDVEIAVEDTDELSKTVEELRAEGNHSGKTQYGMWFGNQAGTFTIEYYDGLSRIICRKYKDVDISIVRSFLLGNVLAIMLTQRGKIVIHGSTLVMGDKTFMVCGDSGAGKSTLSMALQDKGAKLMADDISVIDADSDGECYAYSGFPEQKLCRDAAERQGYDLDLLKYVNEDHEKHSIDRNDIFLEGKRRPVAMFVLRKKSADAMSTKVMASEITGADKVNAITDRFFLSGLYHGVFVLEPEEMMKCVMLAG